MDDPLAMYVVKCVGENDDLADSLTRDARRKATAHFQIHGRVGRSGVEAALDDIQTLLNNLNKEANQDA